MEFTSPNSGGPMGAWPGTNISGDFPGSSFHVVGGSGGDKSPVDTYPAPGDSTGPERFAGLDVGGCIGGDLK